MKYFPLHLPIRSLVPALLVLLLLVVIGDRLGVTMAMMTRDMASQANVHPLTGMLSNFGVLLWCTATAVCLFTASVMRPTGSGEGYRFLLASGFLSAYLTLDDLFLIHEILAPRYLGLRERMVKVVLAVAVLSYLLRFRTFILRTDYGGLILALGLLSSSLIFDQIPHSIYAALGPWDWQHLLEDGCKWLGIAAWCGYLLHTARQLLTRS